MATRGLLSGRLALVTGGGSGIGRAVCSVFAREGALLAVTDINLASAKETVALLPNSAQHAAYKTDVGSAAEVTNLLKEIEDQFRTAPSVAVNAAGINKDNYMLKLDEDSFDSIIKVNLKGTFLVNQAVGRAMVKSQVKHGSIINISSIVGKTGNPGQVNYSAAKAGVIGLTKTAAKELARFNIRVNVILPGFIETPMTNKMPEDIVKAFIARIPLARMGKPEEVAEVCAFLASASSSYITGAVIDVTGGLNF
uniref:(3R)-3-hydroxyacyl-CoA dehydrogenase n=1 Tax=Arion vulgaris TaxID=1028688 RepID=A0A0B7AA30_9EUPU